MRGKLLIGLFVFLVTMGQAHAANWPPAGVEVVPPNPTPSDVVDITLSGEWSSHCIPNGSLISVVGDEIFFDVIVDYPSGAVCLTVITPWARTESVGPLAPGTYSVYAGLKSSPGSPVIYTLMTEFSVMEPVVPEIDVRPYVCVNRVVARPERLIPVAILGSQEIDVLDVDVTTLAFGPGAAAPAIDLSDPLVYAASLRDVNDDGEDDLVAPFLYGETELPLGEGDACLTGEIAGSPFEACDTVLVVMPVCGLGFELLFILPPLMWLRGWRRRSPT